jgi:hypothetical protein
LESLKYELNEEFGESKFDPALFTIHVH